MSEPFLPAPDALPRKSNSRRVVILWFALIFLFLSIWQFVSPDSRSQAGAHAAPPPPCASDPLAPWLTILPFFVTAAVVLLVFRRFAQSATFQHDLEPGRLALAHRRFPEAVQTLKLVVQKYTRKPLYRAASLLWLADAQMRAGTFDDALTSCTQVESTNMLGLGSALRVHVAGVTALVCALRGDLPLAERWLTNGRARLTKMTVDDRVVAAARFVLAEGALLARKGDAAGAIKLLDANVSELSYALTHATMKYVEILRAFAESAGDMRATNTVGERLLRIEPVAPGELSFLGAEWPEMKTFLQAHGL